MFGLHEEKVSPTIESGHTKPTGSSRFENKTSDRLESRLRALSAKAAIAPAKKVSLLESSIKFFLLKLQSVLKIYLEQLSHARQELMCQFEQADKQMTRLEYDLMCSTTMPGVESLLQKSIQAQSTLDQILSVLMELDVLVSGDSTHWSAG